MSRPESSPLGLIVLQLLRAEPTNERLAQRIQAIPQDGLTINAGSLYPALYRLERVTRAQWDESKTGRSIR